MKATASGPPLARTGAERRRAGCPGARHRRVRQLPRLRDRRSAAIVLTVPREVASRCDDSEYLRTVQYADESNLAARQSLYAFEHPRIHLAAAVINAARHRGARFWPTKRQGGRVTATSAP